MAQGYGNVMEGLNSSTVHRKLDARLKILGFEVMDLIAVLTFAAVNNLIWGRSSLAPLFVLVLPMIGAIVLYTVKRNRPEGFLIHWLRYISTPGLYSAAQKNKYLEEKRKRFIA